MGVSTLHTTTLDAKLVITTVTNIIISRVAGTGKSLIVANAWAITPFKLVFSAFAASESENPAPIYCQIFIKHTYLK